MELTYTCSQCSRANRVPTVETALEATCAGCGARHEIRRSAAEDGTLEACPWCATTDLYLQKDFPQGLGMAILVVGFAISTVFWYYQMPLATFAVLIASVAIDWWLYYRVPEVTVCYRCLSQIRGAGADGAGRVRPFDLAIGERYRQERIRIEELRGRSVGADAVSDNR